MDSSQISLLANAGVAGVIIILIIAGWLIPKWAYDKLEQENKLLREALDLERQRAGEASSTASTTNSLISALTDLASERRALPHSRDPAASWKDVS